MIRYVDGNILDDDAEALVNPVNCVGVMGAGLARQFKERFPDNYARYLGMTCPRGLSPGRVYLVDRHDHGAPRWIANFPTKNHWRDPSRIEWVADGLVDLARQVRGRIRSIALPMLGCGLGGLNFADVRPLIERAFAGLPDVDVRVYGPPA